MKTSTVLLFLLGLLAVATVIAINAPLKNEQGDISDDVDSSFDEEEVEQLKLGNHYKPSPKQKPSPYTPKPKYTPKSSSSSMSSKSSSSSKSSKSSKSSSSSSSSSSDEPTQPVVTYPPVTKAAKPTKAAKSSKSSMSSKSSSSSSSSMSSMSSSSSMSSKSSSSSSSEEYKVKPTKAYKPKPAKPTKATRPTADPCAISSSSSSSKSSSSSVSSTSSVSSVSSSSSSSSMGMGKSSSSSSSMGMGKSSSSSTTTTVIDCGPTCNGTVCNGVCCGTSQNGGNGTQFCCNGLQCLPIGASCCPNNQFLATPPAGYYTGNNASDYLCCAQGEVNCGGVCVTQDRCCGYGQTLNVVIKAVGSSDLCCNTNAGEFSLNFRCCPVPGSQYTLPCAQECCGSTCCSGVNSVCANSSLSLCCAQGEGDCGGQCCPAGAGKCCDTSSGRVCCSGTTTCSVPNAASHQGVPSPSNRCCATGYETCGTVCCPLAQGFQCNRGVCCNPNQFQFLPVLFFNGTTNGTPNPGPPAPTIPPAGSILSGFMDAYNNPHQFECVIDINEQMAQQCPNNGVNSGTGQNQPVELRTRLVGSSNDRPCFNPDDVIPSGADAWGASDFMHTNADRSNLGQTLPCVFPQAFQRNSAEQSGKGIVWQSDVVAGVNRLVVNQQIDNPSAFLISLSLFHNRALNNSNGCLQGGETPIPISAGNPCLHWPFTNGGGGSCSIGNLASTTRVIGRVYLHFKDINNVDQRDIVYDIIPGVDTVEIAQNAVANVPLTVAYPVTQLRTWGSGGNGLPRIIYSFGIPLPAEYRTYIFTGYDYVDSSNGDTAIARSAAGQAPAPVPARAIPSGTGIGCRIGTNARVPKVQTTIWATSIFQQCATYVPPSSGDARGYPA